MSTRCVIQVKEGGRVYTLYRHCDGYPSGVLADLKKMWDTIKPGNPGYFLANFVFLAKYNSLKQGYSWDIGYGVGSNSMGEEHGDLEYIYKIWHNRSEGWYIEIWERYVLADRESWINIYAGKLEEAFEKFVKGKEGCHIREIPPLL